MVTKEQALSSNNFHYYNAEKKRCFSVRRNGATKTWKTRPLEFRVPVKYGLYEYSYVEHDAPEWHIPEECPYK